MGAISQVYQRFRGELTPDLSSQLTADGEMRYDQDLENLIENSPDSEFNDVPSKKRSLMQRFSEKCSTLYSTLKVNDKSRPETAKKKLSSQQKRLITNTALPNILYGIIGVTGVYSIYLAYDSLTTELEPSVFQNITITAKHVGVFSGAFSIVLLLFAANGLYYHRKCKLDPHLATKDLIQRYKRFEKRGYDCSEEILQARSSLVLPRHEAKVRSRRKGKRRKPVA